MSKAYLIAEDGTVWEGTSIGTNNDTDGELVFTTGVVGYMETLTDSASVGQIVVQSFPQIGNYGVMEDDVEGPYAAKGYVVKEICDTPSNFRAQYALDAFLKNKGIPGIAGVDTRSIVRHLQDKGTMRARICHSLPEDSSVFFCDSFSIPRIGCAEIKTFLPEGECEYTVSVMDFGISASSICALTKRGCKVVIHPQDTTADVLCNEVDAVFISNGPENPYGYTSEIEEIRKIIGKVPVIGVGLGHQLVALAMGGTITKLPHGHRGDNYPARYSGGMTSCIKQNHGYAVDKDSVNGIAEETFVNLHDGTNEGLFYSGKNCSTVQFYPIGKTEFVWDKFVDGIGACTYA